MTSMVPAAQTLSKQQHHRHLAGDYAGCGTGYTNYREDFGLMSRTVDGNEYFSTDQSCLGSDPVVGDQNMAEDESRTNSSLHEAASTSSKVLNIHQEDRDEGWLKLSIGAGGHAACSHNSKHDIHDQTARRGSGGSIELDLFSGGSASQQARPLAPIFHVPEFRVPRATSFSTSLFFQHPPGSSTSNFPHHQEINWPAFRPVRHNLGSTLSSSTSSSSSLIPFGSYFAQPPLQLQSMMDVNAGPSLDFRVIDPPRRPQSGIWFMLRASQNQTKEPFLPQIPKNYLRIKDGRMTVRLLMKYLVNKLKLDSESEIQITCRGEELEPFLTLQHVRDNIWRSICSPSMRPPEAVPTLLPDSSVVDDHVMVLYYCRSTA